MAQNGFHRFSHGHQDLVLAISYNFYGTRMATASSDHRVKVWDRDEKTGQWTVTDVWTAHDGEVTDVKWNGPFVGSHIATIGEDGLLKVWEEDLNEAANTGRRFKKIFEHSTITGVPFMSVDFKNIGIETYLTMVTRDGHLSILEPEDQSDLRTLQMLWSAYLCKTPPRTEETGFRVSWHKEKLPAWPAILAGLDRKSLSFAVSVGDAVRVYRTDQERNFYVAAVLEDAKALVRDVSWASGSMRGFDMVATASKDGCVRIYELHTPGVANPPFAATTPKIEQASTEAHGGSGRQARSGIGAGLASNARGRKHEPSRQTGAVKQEPKLVAELETHAGAPWRVDWTPMGDILVSTGDDGVVKLWKRAVDGRWLEAAEVDASKEA